MGNTQPLEAAGVAGCETRDQGSTTDRGGVHYVWEAGALTTLANGLAQLAAPPPRVNCRPTSPPVSGAEGGNTEVDYTRENGLSLAMEIIGDHMPEFLSPTYAQGFEYYELLDSLNLLPPDPHPLTDVAPSPQLVPHPPSADPPTYLEWLAEFCGEILPYAHGETAQALPPTSAAPIVPSLPFSNRMLDVPQFTPPAPIVPSLPFPNRMLDVQQCTPLACPPSTAVRPCPPTGMVLPPSHSPATHNRGNTQANGRRVGTGLPPTPSLATGNTRNTLDMVLTPSPSTATTKRGNTQADRRRVGMGLPPTSSPTPTNRGNTQTGTGRGRGITSPQPSTSGLSTASASNTNGSSATNSSPPSSSSTNQAKSSKNVKRSGKFSNLFSYLLRVHHQLTQLISFL